MFFLLYFHCHVFDHANHIAITMTRIVNWLLSRLAQPVHLLDTFLHLHHFISISQKLQKLIDQQQQVKSSQRKKKSTKMNDENDRERIQICGFFFSVVWWDFFLLLFCFPHSCTSFQRLLSCSKKKMYRNKVKKKKLKIFSPNDYLSCACKVS
jgi:hypothetical protein